MKINWTTSCAPQPDFNSSPIPKVVLATNCHISTNLSTPLSNCCLGGKCAGGTANDLGAAGDARRSGSVEPNSRASQYRPSVLPALDRTLQQVLSTHFQQDKQVQQVDLLQNSAVIAITTET